VLFLSITPVFGQSATAEFNGTMVDQSGVFSVPQSLGVT
jgi:hypothetical protein